MSAMPSAVLWSRAEFQKLGGLGCFEGRRAMLIRGVIYEEGPMDPPHATGIGLVERWLNRTFGAGYDVRPRLPLAFGIDTEPSPDIALVRGAIRDFVSEHPTPAQTALIVEVADTSLFFDMTTKAELYAAAGIAEYWVVDVLNRRLTVLRSPAPLPPAGHAYQSVAKYLPADSVAPLAAPASPVLVSELMP